MFINVKCGGEKAAMYNNGTPLAMLIDAWTESSPKEYNDKIEELSGVDLSTARFYRIAIIKHNATKTFASQLKTLYEKSAKKVDPVTWINEPKHYHVWTIARITEEKGTPDYEYMEYLYLNAPPNVYNVKDHGDGTYQIYWRFV